MARRLRAIVHIGTEKTGTSTLQRTLLKNEKTLLADGIFYRHHPRRGESRDFAAACIGDRKPDDWLRSKKIDTVSSRRNFRNEFFSQLTTELDQLPNYVHTVLISSEHFHSRLTDVQMIERIKTWLTPYVDEFCIICYLRRQVDMVTSLYSTALKNGQAVTFEEHTNKKLQSNSHYCNYEKMLTKWENVFGRSAINVRLYNHSELIQNNVVDDFMRAIGYEGEDLDRDVPTTNSSVNALGQDLLFKLNAAFSDVQDDQKLENAKKVRREIAKAFIGKGRAMEFKQIATFQERFADSNRNVQQKWFPGRDGKLFPDEPIETEEINKDVNQVDAIFDLYALLNTEGMAIHRYQELDRYVNNVRDTAIAIEHTNPNKAKLLLELAHVIRPSGPNIKKRLNRLTAEIGN